VQLFFKSDIMSFLPLGADNWWSRINPSDQQQC